VDTLHVRPHAADLLSLSATIENVRLILLYLPIPRYPKLADSTPTHSHSILSAHRNTLIYQHNFFLLTVKTRPPCRQNFSLLDSKGNLRGSDFVRFRGLSTTIGQFFASSIAERVLHQDEKRLSAPIARCVRTGDVCIHLITRTRPTIFSLPLIRRFNEAEVHAPRMPIGVFSPWII